MRFLFLFCLVAVVSRCFLPVIYRRGVRYSRCPSLWLLFDCCTPFPPPSFYSAVWRTRCPCPCFVFLFGLSYTTYSCSTHIICGYPGLFRFCSLVSPPLNPFLTMMSSAGYFHARFLLSAFFSFFRPCSSPICFGVTSSIL